MVLILAALQKYNFLTVANTVVWLVVMLCFIGTTLIGRYGIRPEKIQRGQ
jgi:hypothetical protein